MSIHHRIVIIVLAGTLGLALSSAEAAEAPTSGAAVAGIGRWIAAQGNTALEQLRRDLKRDLRDSLKPLLPERAPADEPAPPAAQRPSL